MSFVRISSSGFRVEGTDLRATFEAVALVEHPVVDDQPLDEPVGRVRQFSHDRGRQPIRNGVGAGRSDDVAPDATLVAEHAAGTRQATRTVAIRDLDWRRVIS